MADQTPSNPGPFDVGTIKALVAMMSRHNLSEIDLQQGEQRIRLRRGPRVVTTTADPFAMQATSAIQPTTPSAPSPARNEAPGQAPAPASPARVLHEIKSPTPGTFYARPSPDAEPYVKVGSKVTPESVVCLIEAMKLFTEIFAEVNGVIAEILVQDKQPVEYGTVLFRVDPLG